MRFLKNIIFVLIFIPAILKAQDEFTTGSPYTIFGMGDIQYYSSNRTEAMSSLGLALPGDYINSFNPAANYKLSYTLFSMGFKYTMLNSKGYSTSKMSEGNISGFNLGIPISQDKGIAANIGFNPITQIGYKIIANSFANGDPVAETFAGSGGLTKINIGLSYCPVSNVSLGFEYNYAFGNVKTLELINFQNPNITNSYRKSENSLTGSYVKGGLVINLGRIIKSLKGDEFYIGGMFQTGLKLNSSLEEIWNTSLGNDTTRMLPANYSIPIAYGFGMSNKFGDRYIVAGDVYFQNWEDFKISDIKQPGLQNSMKVSLGLEITPPNRNNLSFWSNKYYRMGAYYEKTNYNVNSQSIDGYGFSLGIGIPLTRYNSVDLSVTYAHRGRTDNYLVQDDMLKLSAGFNFGELWFIRTRDEDK